MILFISNIEFSQVEDINLCFPQLILLLSIRGLINKQNNEFHIKIFPEKNLLFL